MDKKREKENRSSSETALVPAHSLSRYMQQVSQYPILTDEEERELVERVRLYRDREAARKLVTSHLRLVVKIAMEYRTAFQNILDLIQEGNIGLLRAVQNFNPNKGARLAYYASLWIRSYILKYLLDNFRLIKIGTTQAQRKLFFNLIKEKEKLELMGINPNARLLAERLDVKEEEVNEMGQRLLQSELSIDAPVGGEAEGPLHVDFLKSSDPPADEKISDREFKDVLIQKLDEFSKLLNGRELKIFQERLVAEMPKTLQEIADEHGITRERVRQIEERIKMRLKKYFEESGVQVEENF